MTKSIYTPTRQSSAIGLGFLGLSVIVGSYVLFKWQINPYIRKKRSREAEQWADYVFEQEQKTNLESDQK